MRSSGSFDLKRVKKRSPQRRPLAFMIELMHHTFQRPQPDVISASRIPQNMAPPADARRLPIAPQTKTTRPRPAQN